MHAAFRRQCPWRGAGYASRKSAAAPRLPTEEIWLKVVKPGSYLCNGAPWRCQFRGQSGPKRSYLVNFPEGNRVPLDIMWNSSINVVYDTNWLFRWAIRLSESGFNCFSKNLLTGFRLRCLSCRLPFACKVDGRKMAVARARSGIDTHVAECEWRKRGLAAAGHALKSGARCCKAGRTVLAINGCYQVLLDVVREPSA